MHDIHDIQYPFLTNDTVTAVDAAPMFSYLCLRATTGAARGRSACSVCCGSHGLAHRGPEDVRSYDHV